MVPKEMNEVELRSFRSEISSVKSLGTEASLLCAFSVSSHGSEVGVMYSKRICHFSYERLYAD